MIVKNRYFTKSLFKIALGCPTKLSFINKNEFADNRLDNDFLKSLADGGFQVNELAKIMYPKGIEITEINQLDQVNKTYDLLKKDNVTIFEGTIQINNYLIRIDIINKTGNHIEIIEVKSKSFNSKLGKDQFWTKGSRKLVNKKIDSKYLIYLQDVAFQTMIFNQAFPNFITSSYLMMPDKSKKTSVEGLNQQFKIYYNNGKTYSKPVDGTNINSIGDFILDKVNIDEYINNILNNNLETPGYSDLFQKVILNISNLFKNDQLFKPILGKHCATCEFNDKSFPNNKLRSGFHECWKHKLGWHDEDFNNGTVLDLIKSKKKQNFIDNYKYKLSDLTMDDIQLKKDSDGLTISERQLMQITGNWKGRKEFYLDTTRIKELMNNWIYPLHFIDFEVCQPVLPFSIDKSPFSRIIFQYSHHIMEKNGKVRHANEFINIKQGYDPSYDFINSLKNSLGNVGSVFMWSPYENTILTSLLDKINEDELKDRAPSNSNELKDFILSLIVIKEGKNIINKGNRSMQDLAKIADKLFFHPFTKGRSSIKVILPAVLQSSTYLRDRYSKSIYGSKNGIESKNFTDKTWWILNNYDNQPLNPYKLLPKIFEDMEIYDNDNEGEIREGGAAATAYAKLQFSDVSEKERLAIKNALLRYCELDTLAMVMVVEAWREWSVHD
jgi:hypothetical protein